MNITTVTVFTPETIHDKALLHKHRERFQVVEGSYLISASDPFAAEFLKEMQSQWVPQGG